MEIFEVPVGYQTTPGGTKPFTLNPFLQTWLLGKTRTGKSTVMLSAFSATVRAGYGCLLQDPNVSLAEGALHYIPKDRLKDVILIDGSGDRVPGVGYFDGTSSELSIQGFMANMEAKSGRGWGPQSAEWFRAAADAVSEAFGLPTILEIYKFLVRDKFRLKLLKRSKNPLVRDFYEKWYSKKVQPRQRMEAASHPANKVSDLVRPGIRDIVCQKTALDWATLMDERKIVIVRLAKHEIGKFPAQTIGNLCLMNIINAAPKRKQYGVPWPCFVDEIHNFLDAVDFESALAELAKTGVTFFFATQTTAQMRDEERGIRNDEIAAGNCSSIISFRVSGTDSEKIALNAADKEHAPSLVELPNYTFYAWTLRGALPVLEGPVNIYYAPAKYGDEVPYKQAIEWIRNNSGTERSVVEKDILKRLADDSVGSPRPSRSSSQHRARG